MVNIVEDWGILEEYAGDKFGFYQLIGTDGIFEIRVQTGRVGFRREFKDGGDELLIRILRFCKRRGYIKVIETSREEAFFK